MKGICGVMGCGKEGKHYAGSVKYAGQDDNSVEVKSCCCDDHYEQTQKLLSTEGTTVRTYIPVSDGKVRP